MDGFLEEHQDPIDEFLKEALESFTKKFVEKFLKLIHFKRISWSNFGIHGRVDEGVLGKKSC